MRKRFAPSDRRLAAKGLLRAFGGFLRRPARALFLRAYLFENNRRSFLCRRFDKTTFLTSGDRPVYADKAVFGGGRYFAGASGFASGGPSAARRRSSTRFIKRK